METGKREQQLAAGYYVIELLNAALAERSPLPKPENLTWEEIHRMAKMHSVEAMAYSSAAKVFEETDSAILNKWQGRSMKCAAQGKVQLAERPKLRKAFSEKGIRILPLKGWFLKEMYPNSEWRQMSDLDILIDDEQSDRAYEVMTALGYEAHSFKTNDHHDEYHKKPWLNVEVHRCLLHEDLENVRKYDDIWERAVLQEDGSFRMKWEDYYLFMLEHLAKHYNAGGCGIRSIMDIYIFLHNQEIQLDQKYLQKRLEEHRLLDFRKKMESIADSWFAKNERSTEYSHAEIRLIVSGVYGNRGNAIQSEREKRIDRYHSVFLGKLSRVRDVVFLDYGYMSGQYPILKKAPFLLPFAWVHRGIRTILKKRYRIREEYEEVRRKWKKIEK